MEPIFRLEEIPEEFGEAEIILKGVYDPMNFNRTGVKKNIFIPPAGSDELSVIRLAYSTLIRCKFHCKFIETPNRNYWGFAKIIKQQIYSVIGCSLVHTPQTYPTYTFMEHADLKLPFSRPINANEPLPIDDDRIVEQLYSLASTHKDDDVANDDWVGDALN